jgi:AraC-like DNA-binding protein
MDPTLPVIQSYVPTGPLKELVYAILYVRGLGTGLALQRVYQNIIINVGGNFHTSSPFEDDTPTENKATVWINGKHETPFYLGHNGTPEFYILAVKQGMLPFFTSVPVRDTNETALPAEVWGPTSIIALQQELQMSNDVASNFAAIERHFTHEVPEPSAGVLKKIAFLADALPTHTVAQLCHVTGYTRKRLWQEVLKHFGSSIKEMQGIIRFDNHLKAISENTQKNFSALHTFYDQAHFIHDFKSRTRLTPNQYRLLCNHYTQIRRHPNFIPINKETFLQFYYTGVL